MEISVLEKVKVGRLIVKLIGQAQTGWKNKNSEVLYESNEQVLNEYIDLTRFASEFQLTGQLYFAYDRNLLWLLKLLVISSTAVKELII